jgi:hypothetical protein
MHLRSNNIPTDQWLIIISDSSVNDDVHTGRKKGCFLIFYMGGIVDHSSNIPDPIALSSAEAEYNQACVATMALLHIPSSLTTLRFWMKTFKEQISHLFLIAAVPLQLEAHFKIQNIQDIS